MPARGIGNSRNARTKRTHGRVSFLTRRTQRLFKSRRVVRFFFQRRIPRVAAPLCFPNRYSLLASVMVDTECPWYTRNPSSMRRIGRHGPKRREVHGARSLEGALPLFVPSRRIMVPRR